MSDRVALVTVDDAARAYDFGSSHPLRPERVLLTYDRIAELGLAELPEVTMVQAHPAEERDVLRVHGSEYVDAVKAAAGSLDGRAGFAFGLGTPDNPIFPRMHEASLAVAGATLAGARALFEGADHAFNPAGGLHHARRIEASGFCIYNDPAIAIAQVLEWEPEWRVMYIDVDVHHGDGVQWIFYDDPRVLTVSLHQSGHYLYPGTGFEDELGAGDARGTAANIPLLPGTGSDDYLWALEATVPPLAHAFRPQVVVTQLGGDTHHGDPLANLALTMDAYPRMAALLHALVHDLGARWLATGGGGYQATTIVPMIWTIYFAEMCGRPDLIPSAWIDGDAAPATTSRRAPVEESVARVLAECLPRLESLASA